MSGPVITAEGVSRWYGEIIGLNNFSLEIGEGITAIVGPNGAGKSMRGQYSQSGREGPFGASDPLSWTDYRTVCGLSGADRAQ